MGRFGALLLVTSVTALAHGTEPTGKRSPAPAPPYAAVALTDTHAHLVAHVEFQTERLPPHPLRASMTSNELSAVGASPVSERTIRVVLDTEAVASFPTDSDSDSTPVLPTPVPSSPSRLLTIRKNLDDDASVFEHRGVTRRLIRQSLDDAGDWATVSAGRRLRSRLD